MRSSDAVFGYGNDVPFFSFVQECVLQYLNMDREAGYSMGDLTIFSGSLHVYERHFELLEKLTAEDVMPIDCPRLLDAAEVSDLRAGCHDLSRGRTFTPWLLSRDIKRREA